MIIRKPVFQLNSIILPLIALFFSSCNAFTFTLSSQPSQCQTLTAQWLGGTGPYRLFLIPVGHVTPEVRTIVNMEIPANQSSATLTLKFPENSQFVAVMSDSTGFGTGGTSTIYTVGSGASDCLPTSPVKTDFFMYFANPTPSQCGSFGITWDGDVSNVHIYGIIPGGQSFDLGAPTTGTGFDWTVNVRQGTEMLFLAVGGGDKNGGSTDITKVSSGSSGCINAQSPSSTAGPAAGAVSTAPPASSGSPTASANPTQSGGTMGVSASATGTTGATAAPGASGTTGATGTPGASTTGSPGGGGDGGGNNYPSATQGSDGGTVTGDPNLPAATSNSMDNRRSLNLGAIIGGTLGGLSAILLLLLLWLLCARRRRANDYEDDERLISHSQHRRTDLLADSVPIIHRNSGHQNDWFRAEPFVPPMSAAEFARRTGADEPTNDEDHDEEYHDDNHEQYASSLGHGAVTNSTAAAAMYGALARTPSYSTSGHGHRTSHSQSNSHGHSHNVSHSSAYTPAHSSSHHNTSAHGHSRSFSNPFSLSFTPTSNVSRTGRDVEQTPPTPMSMSDPFATAVSRPPPSSWNQASGSSNAVPRARQSAEFIPDRKSGEENVTEPVIEEDVVDIPPSYASVKRLSRRVMNP